MDEPIDFAGAAWKISLEKSPVKEHPDALDFKLNFKIISGTAENVSVSAPGRILKSSGREKNCWLIGRWRRLNG